jgi:hypothetical protein
LVLRSDDFAQVDISIAVLNKIHERCRVHRVLAGEVISFVARGHECVVHPPLAETGDVADVAIVVVVESNVRPADRKRRADLTPQAEMIAKDRETSIIASDVDSAAHRRSMQEESCRY